MATLKDIIGEWAPTERLAQFELGTPIAPIDYTEECTFLIREWNAKNGIVRTLMDIFRYALQKDEISERVYRLTKAVISQNSGNYTAWLGFILFFK